MPYLQALSEFREGVRKIAREKKGEAGGASAPRRADSGWALLAFRPALLCGRPGHCRTFSGLTGLLSSPRAQGRRPPCGPQTFLSGFLCPQSLRSCSSVTPCGMTSCLNLECGSKITKVGSAHCFWGLMTRRFHRAGQGGGGTLGGWFAESHRRDPGVGPEATVFVHSERLQSRLGPLVSISSRVLASGGRCFSRCHLGDSPCWAAVSEVHGGSFDLAEITLRFQRF